ncbi:MAG: BON domain-containing protein [Candidatus Omnitrophota bacterium]
MINGEEQIKRAIVEALCEDPDVDAAGISVRVTGSLVVLTGTVPNQRARDAAYRDALLSDDIEVKNFIVVNDNPIDDPKAHIA